jgi:hypothetical protein
VACKIAQTSSETGTGFTNASGTIILVYRGVNQGLTCQSVSVGGATVTDNVNNATLSYAGITLTNTNATSWVIGCGGSNTATNVNQAPTGMTTVTSVTGNSVSCADTNAPVSAFTTQTVGVNASAPWNTAVLEIRTCQTGACLIDEVTGSGTTATTVASAAASHAAGHKLVAMTDISGTGISVTGIANTAGDTWAQCSGSRQNTQFATEIWETTGNTNTNATDVTTVTFGSGGSFNRVVVLEVSGVQLGACETGKIGTATGATSVTSASFSPALAGNFNAAIAITNTGPLLTVGTNYVATPSYASGNPMQEFRANAPSGAQTVSASTGGTVNWGISVASFKGITTAGGQLGNFITGP